jgi:hypothetical protein
METMGRSGPMRRRFKTIGQSSFRSSRLSTRRPGIRSLSQTRRRRDDPSLEGH